MLGPSLGRVTGSVRPQGCVPAGIGVGSRGSAQKQRALLRTPSFLLHRGVGAFLVPREEVGLLEKTPSGLQKANLALLTRVAAGQMSAGNSRLRFSPVL